MSKKTVSESSVLKSAPVPTLRRLPVYLDLLKKISLAGESVVSCTRIAEDLNITPIQVRKDIEVTAIRGTPRVGYVVLDLIVAIETFLGWHNTRQAFLVGAGNLGSAIMGYQGFRDYGMEIVAAFDTNNTIVGTYVHGIRVMHINKLSDLCRRMKVKIGILTVPAAAAQLIGDMMVAAGIQAIWNFAPVSLKVPSHIIAQNEHLAASLAVLSRQLTVVKEVMNSKKEEQ